jgi:hypothetical protein
VTSRGGRQAFESPDGRFVFYAKSGIPGIWGVPAQGGQEIQVLDQGALSHWALTARGIYVVNPKAVPGPTIHLYSFASRRLSPIATLSKPLDASGSTVIAVSHNDRWILCVLIDRSESDIMLVENFQ